LTTKARPTLEDRQRRAEETPAHKRERDVALMQHYRSAFGTDSGRIVLADMLRRCGVLMPSPDPYHEGQRSVGLHMIEMLTRDLSQLTEFTMTSEVGELLS
jgi:hypothetical protein